MPVMVDGLDAVSTAALNGDIDAVADTSIDLWIALGNEVRWLNANPAAACYTSTHSVYSEAIDLLHESMDQISDGALYYDVDLINSGTELMLLGNAKLSQATAGVPASTVACGL